MTGEGESLSRLLHFIAQTLIKRTKIKTRLPKGATNLEKFQVILFFVTRLFFCKKCFIYTFFVDVDYCCLCHDAVWPEERDVLPSGL